MGVNCVTAKSPTMISAAKMAPAIGALKVAEMPAAAPQATSVRIAVVSSFSHWPRVEPKAEPIWTIGPSRPDRAAGPDGDRRGDGLDGDDARPDDAAAHGHRLHDLGDAVALGFAREEVDEGADDQAADGGDRDAPPPTDAFGDGEGIGGLGEEALFEQVVQPAAAFERNGLHSADHQAEDHGADGADDACEDRRDHHVEVAALLEEFAASGGGVDHVGSDARGARILAPIGSSFSLDRSTGRMIRGESPGGGAW